MIGKRNQLRLIRQGCNGVLEWTEDESVLDEEKEREVEEECTWCIIIEGS